jgi:hypothetical protein
VLEHCSLDGKKVNRFIDNLAINQTSDIPVRVAWSPSNAWRKEKVLVAAQNSGRFDGLA